MADLRLSLGAVLSETGLGQEGLVDSFSLWALFQGLGHVNWEAKNLPDIELEVDYTEARFTLTVMDWEAEKQLTYQM